MDNLDSVLDMLNSLDEKEGQATDLSSLKGSSSNSMFDILSEEQAKPTKKRYLVKGIFNRVSGDFSSVQGLETIEVDLSCSNTHGDNVYYEASGNGFVIHCGFKASRAPEDGRYEVSVEKHGRFVDFVIWSKL